MKNKIIKVRAAGAPQKTMKKVEYPKKKEQNIVAEILNEYCSSSTLHGISYLGAKDKNLVEKIWWLTIFLTSLSFSLYLISETWMKWQENPVLLSFEKEQTRIWEIPFPAVTVCPMNKVQKTVYNYTDFFVRRDSLSADELKKFCDISQVCRIEEYMPVINCSVDISAEVTIKHILEVAPTKEYTVKSAAWIDEIDTDIFNDQLDKEGLCFSFNAFNYDDMFTSEIDADKSYLNNHNNNTTWHVENGYTRDLKAENYPRRTALNGYGSGLSLLLKQYVPDTDYVCGMPVSGYKIILHNPAELAAASQSYYLIDKDKMATILVKPDLIRTSTSLRHLPARVRKCYFANEKSLRFFKVYTYNNCRTECASNVTVNYCGCVPFYLPRGRGTSMCGIGKLECLVKIRDKILHFEILQKDSQTLNTYDEEMQTETYNIYAECDCMPACNNLQFTAETSLVTIDYHNELIQSGLLGNFSEQQKSDISHGKVKKCYVEIFFKETQFLSLQRTELNTQTDFIANCGGLLGLCIGFSVLSFVEIIYFLTLRLWCKIRRRKSVKRLATPIKLQH